MTKCEVRNQKVEACETLSKAIGHGHKGLRRFEWRDVGSNTLRTGVVVKAGDDALLGMLVVYCPFCGANIGGHFQPLLSALPSQEEPGEALP